MSSLSFTLIYHFTGPLVLFRVCPGKQASASLIRSTFKCHQICPVEHRAVFQFGKNIQMNKIYNNKMNKIIKTS